MATTKVVSIRLSPSDIKRFEELSDRFWRGKKTSFISYLLYLIANYSTADDIRKVLNTYPTKGYNLRLTFTEGCNTISIHE